MRIRNARVKHLRQAGFSMVEMLMAAFVMAIGLLGLAMLQTMSLRATRGSQNLGIAVQLAEQVMDEVESEGRLTYLNANITGYTAPTALNGLTFINQAAVDQYFTIDSASGQTVLTNSPTGALFHVTMNQIGIAGATGLSDVTVTVQFTDATTADNQAITRSAVISRRILHG